ncbi:SDR family oxidoreductase [Nonomuraea polychroma]|uniref:SDR family oxidoreductase n=1 Tax=Nonomuraea polychroma TaxID=46176 RepID=UPI000FDE4B34
MLDKAERVAVPRAGGPRGRHITVNAVAPGPTATPPFLEGKSQEAVDQIASMNPMGRLGTPEDIAETLELKR